MPAQEARFSGRPDVPEPGDTLSLPLPEQASEQRIQDSVHAWLQRQARWWFGLRLQHFLEISGQSLQSGRLSAATTRWGSCTSARRILLNWRLIHFNHDVIDYVIAQVAHLREMNHSPPSGAKLRLMPHYAPARLELKRHRPGVLPCFKGVCLFTEFTMRLYPMIRVGDLEKSLPSTQTSWVCVCCAAGLSDGRFTLAFVGYQDEDEGAVLELTHNWDTPS